MKNLTLLQRFQTILKVVRNQQKSKSNNQKLIKIGPFLNGSVIYMSLDKVL